MKSTGQRVCALASVPMVILWILGLWVIARFVAPPAPTHSAQGIADIFADNTNYIRTGVLLCAAGAAFVCPFVSAISVQLRRIEGPRSPYASAQLSLGTCLTLEFIIPLMLLQTAAYRQDRTSGAIQTLNDAAWLMFLGVTFTAILQVAVIGLAILQAGPTNPAFPRWAGYFNLWCALLFCPGSFCVYFKDGPLAWNGWLTFWLPFGVFFIWIGVMTVLLLKAIANDEATRPDEVPAGTDPASALRMSRLEAETAQLRRELESVSALVDRSQPSPQA